MRKIRNIQFLRSLLMALITSYVIGITILTHTHIVNHELITHSHPFKSGKHHHTENEFYFIRNVTHFNTTTNIVPEYDIENPNTPLAVISTVCLQNKTYQKQHTTPSLRAPPSTLIA